MSYLPRLRSGTALLMTLGLATSAVAPIIAAAPAFAQARFTDVSSGYWAEDFIVDLANKGIIAGFPDGSFKPNDPVTRAQFAAMVKNAFNQSKNRANVSFVDVPSGYWAAPAIGEAYQMGFLSGYPGNIFRPGQNIPRVQVLVSLANGLNYSASSTSSVQIYNDASAIPNWAVSNVAAATEKQLVVNYPNVSFLNPNQVATRADVAAFIYQALASQGQVAKINSPYIVGQTQQPNPPAQVAIPAGTTIPVAYDKAEKIVLLPEETVPLSLKVTQSITTTGGRVLIPAGSTVEGELRPQGEGSQFVAKQLVLTNGTRLSMNAQSQTITETETIRKGINVGTVLAGAVVGSGAATAIAGVTGDRTIEALEVLAGTAAGTVAGVLLGRQKVDVIVVDADTDMALTLNSNLVLPNN